jgi:hypothetical protein
MGEGGPHPGPSPAEKRRWGGVPWARQGSRAGQLTLTHGPVCDRPGGRGENGAGTSFEGDAAYCG